MSLASTRSVPSRTFCGKATLLTSCTLLGSLKFHLSIFLPNIFRAPLKDDRYFLERSFKCVEMKPHFFYTLIVVKLSSKQDKLSLLWTTMTFVCYKQVFTLVIVNPIIEQTAYFSFVVGSFDVITFTLKGNWLFKSTNTLGAKK